MALIFNDCLYFGDMTLLPDCKYIKSYILNAHWPQIPTYCKKCRDLLEMYTK